MKFFFWLVPLEFYSIWIGSLDPTLITAAKENAFCNPVMIWMRWIKIKVNISQVFNKLWRHCLQIVLKKIPQSNQSPLFSLKVKSNVSSFNETGQAATCRLKNITINHKTVLDLLDPATLLW